MSCHREIIRLACAFSSLKGSGEHIGRRKEHRFVDGIEQKHCHKCGEWKTLDSFNKNNRTRDKLSATCKPCKAEWSKEWAAVNAEKKVESYEAWRKANPHKFREYSRNYRMRNPEVATEYSRKWRLANPVRDKERRREWRQKNPLKVINSLARRRARKESLPDTLTFQEQQAILETFGGCALTGEQDYHWDHVIPISTGFGGTTVQNVVPLRCDLNLSKHDKNIFTWFESNYERFDLSRERFDELLRYLATVNETSVEEYTDYVFSCFEQMREVG